RKVADAQREVLAILRQEINNPNVVAIMAPVWQKHVHLLYQERCAENIRKTLSRLGIPLAPGTPLASQEPTEIASHPSISDTDMLYTQVFDVTEIQQVVQSNGQGEKT